MNELNKERIVMNLREQKLRMNVYYFDSCESTNKLAKELLANKGETGIVVAREQTAGRGRKDKLFYSVDGGAYFTLCIAVNDEVQQNQIFGSVLLSSIAVRQALSELDINAVVKWPNDVLYQGKKMCGILSEMVYEGNKPKYMIIGVGINVNTKDFGELSKSATSVKIEKGCKKDEDIPKLIARVLKIFFDKLLDDDYDVIQEYKQYCETLNKEVEVMGFTGDVLRGRAVDISDEGFLEVRLLGGNTITVRYGDVSIRSMNN